MKRDELIPEVGRLLPAWTVQVTRFNGIVADRLGVSQTDLQCLYALSVDGPASVGELARRVNLTSGSASRMIDRLEAAGCITRVPDPADRRRLLIEPTQQSLDVVASYYEPLNARLAEHLGALDNAALEGMRTFLEAAQRSTEEEIDRAAGSERQALAGRWPAAG
ncbi:MarR family winged helix-turn-helix transcriptional regulator [Kribbella sp. DT2]|uniref:MarR family winged helix-turn-helix transcriptional regulator n=1 Tax=Kribbella sp. DT2 TaxID=3393427 RepID=UPI003CF41FFE